MPGLRRWIISPENLPRFHQSQPVEPGLVPQAARARTGSTPSTRICPDNMNDLILYTTEDGKTRLDLRADGITIWLTQLEIAELFQTTKHNVSIHTKNIFAEGELTPERTVKESLTVQTEGSRQVRRELTISLSRRDGQKSGIKESGQGL